MSGRAVPWAVPSLLVALTAVAALVGALAGHLDVATAAPWLVTVAANSHGEVRAQPAPAAPASVTATCNSVLVLGNSVDLAWPAISHASTYTVYQSTTAATGPYSATARVGTTVWISPALASGNYWYEVSATIGTNWSGAASPASAKRSITLSLLCV